MEGSERQRAIIQLKSLLKAFPAGIPITELNHVFSRKFGYCLDPPSLGFFTLRAFISHVQAKKIFDVEEGCLIERSCPILESTRIEDDHGSGELTRQLSCLDVEPILPIGTDSSLNSYDCLGKGEHIPQMNLSRPLCKGDLLNVRILYVSLPDQFSFRLIYQDGSDLISEDQVLPSMTSFTQEMTQFYEHSKNKPGLQISEELDAPIEGWTVACPYTSSRTGNVEWRRAIVVERVNTYDEYDIFFLDHGFFATANLEQMKRLHRHFSLPPSQCLNGILAGIMPYKVGTSWGTSEGHCFQKFAKNCKKSACIALVTEHVEQPISQSLKLLLVNPAGYAKEEDLKNACVNFELLQKGLAKFDAKSGDAVLEIWFSNATQLEERKRDLLRKLKSAC